MIFEFIIGLGVDVGASLVESIPTFGAENVVFTTGDVLSPFVGGIASLGAWLPWDALAVTSAIVLPVYLGSLFARFLRAVLGHIPLVGGNG